MQNRAVADANQVTADLNCAPVFGLANWQGNVGIGTTTPQQKLWVHDGDIWASGNHKLGFSTDYSVDAIPNVAFGASGNDAYIANWSSSAYNTNLTVKGSNGFVGIGTTNPAATLHVNGSTILSQGYSTTSDARLKRDIRPVTGALALVAQLQGVRYNWRPVSERTVGKDLTLPLNEPQIGFLAQDLEKVIPEAVVAPKANTNEVYSIKEAKLIPVLVEAIKEQQTQIKTQQSEIAELRADLEKLKSLLRK